MVEFQVNQFYFEVSIYKQTNQSISQPANYSINHQSINLFSLVFLDFDFHFHTHHLNQALHVMTSQMGHMPRPT